MTNDSQQLTRRSSTGSRYHGCPCRHPLARLARQVPLALSRLRPSRSTMGLLRYRRFVSHGPRQIASRKSKCALRARAKAAAVVGVSSCDDAVDFAALLGPISACLSCFAVGIFFGRFSALSYDLSYQTSRMVSFHYMLYPALPRISSFAVVSPHPPAPVPNTDLIHDLSSFLSSFVHCWNSILRLIIISNTSH